MQPFVAANFPIPALEAERQEALRRYGILDTAAEQLFDDFTAVAAIVCDVPIAMITLVSQDRQWFKSTVGISIRQTPHEHAFCTHTIMQQTIFEVVDATADLRFAHNPLVTGDPNIRFYAGSPLVDHDGFALGTICVIDRVPRKLTGAQRLCLEALGRSVTAAIEARRVAGLLAEANRSLATEVEIHRELGRQKDLLLRTLQSNEMDLKALRGLLPICAYCKGIRDESGTWHLLEAFLQHHAAVEFSHGICPGCYDRERVASHG